MALSLAALYAQLNARFWKGQLPPTVPRNTYGINLRAVAVRGIRARFDVAGGRWRALPFKGSQRCIGRFTPPSTYRPALIHVLSPLGAELERQILLHEMVHCCLHFAGVTEEQQHGARFVAELERLASLGEAWATEEAALWRGMIDHI